MSPQCPSKLVPWDLTQFSQLPSAAPLYFPESHQQSEISSLSNMMLVLGKAKSRRVIWCFTKNCIIHDMWVEVLSWWSCQSPVAHSCGLLNHSNSFHRGMFQLSTKFDADSLLYLLSHFECDSHTVHMLTEQHLLPPLTSTVKSSLFTHVHSSPLSLAARFHRCHTNCSCYINNGWTFFSIYVIP